MASAEEPECPICREFYDHQDLCPRLLICGHTFCTSCLEKLVKNNSISCPDCRKKTSVPTGVAGLTKNYALLKIGNTTPQDVEGLHNCEECETKHPATSWCLDCDYDMCKTAARFHTRNKASRDHKVVSLEQLAVSVFCSEHKEQFRLFDAECNHMVCKNCVTLTHKNHRLLSLADVGSKYKQEMETLASQASARAEVIKDAETRVINASLNMKKAYDEQRAKIQSVFKTVSLSLFHVNFYIYFESIKLNSFDMAVPKPWLQESQKAAQSLVTPQPNYLSAHPGFYLGYLRGRSFPPKKNIVIITVFLNY